MINFSKFLKLDNCILLESLAETKKMETHLTHIEDLAIEQGKQGFIKFVNTIRELIKKIQGQESEIDINAKIDGSPALIFGRDPRQQFKDQFFIALKYAVDPSRGVIKEGAKLLHSDSEIDEFYGDRPAFADRLKTLLKELNRAYDNSGDIYQCDVLYSDAKDKTIRRFDGEDYLTFKPNVIVYAVPVDEESDLYNRIQNSIVGISVHDSFRGISNKNYITLSKKSKIVNSLINSGKNANVFIMGSNFGQVSVEIDRDYISEINLLIDECTKYIDNITQSFDEAYVSSQMMEYLKIYINKQVDLPNGGIFGKRFTNKELTKFINGFKLFIKKRFDIEIGKRSTEKGRAGQTIKFKNLMSFLTDNMGSLFSLLKVFTIMISIKKILLVIVEQLTKDLKHAFFIDSDGTLRPTKSEGHVIFNGDTHVKIVDRLEFTKVNRSRGGQKEVETF